MTYREHSQLQHREDARSLLFYFKLSFILAAIVILAAIMGCGGGAGSGASTTSATSSPSDPSVASLVVSAGPVSAPVAQLPVGTSLQLKATLNFTTGAAPKNVAANSIWASTNAKVATVALGGVVVGVAPGTTEITATYETQQNVLVTSAPFTLTVVASAGAPNLPAKTLPAPATVVFLGDAITAAMFTPAVVAAHPTWINGGSPPDFPDETSGDVLARFAAYVTLREPKPDIVHILVGVYDVTSATTLWPAPCGPDPTSPDATPASDLIATCANLIQMVEMAQAAGVKVIYGTLPPLGPGPLASELEAEALTDALGNEANFNRALQYSQGVAPPWIGNQLVDYANDLPTGWTDDGVTPNALGAQEMAAAAEKAIETWPRPLPDAAGAGKREAAK